MGSNILRNDCCWESIGIHWPINEKVPCSFKIQLVLTDSTNIEYKVPNRHEGLECKITTSSSSDVQTVVSYSTKIYHHTGIKWFTQVPNTQPLLIISGCWYIFDAGGPYYAQRWPWRIDNIEIAGTSSIYIGFGCSCRTSHSVCIGNLLT